MGTGPSLLLQSYFIPSLHLQHSEGRLLVWFKLMFVCNGVCWEKNRSKGFEEDISGEIIRVMEMISFRQPHHIVKEA